MDGGAGGRMLAAAAKESFIPNNDNLNTMAYLNCNIFEEIQRRSPGKDCFHYLPLFREFPEQPEGLCTVQ